MSRFHQIAKTPKPRQPDFHPVMPASNV